MQNVHAVKLSTKWTHTGWLQRLSTTISRRLCY